MPLLREPQVSSGAAHASPRRVRVGVFARVILQVCVLLLSTLAAAQPSGRALDGRPGAPDTVRALDLVKADPNLGTSRTIRTLRWKGPAVDNAPTPTLPAWLRRFTELIARSTRYLVWLGALVAAVILAGYIVRMVRDDERDIDLGVGPTPSHVRDLDIRPESLPRDVGAAARGLWERGEARAALALLYRGTLSRLVHVHGVPIRESSTEGDCLRLCHDRVVERSSAYVATLIPAWQRLVYGHQSPGGELVLALCDGFEPALGRTTVAMSQPEPTR